LTKSGYKEELTKITLTTKSSGSGDFILNWSSLPIIFKIYIVSYILYLVYFNFTTSSQQN